MAVKKSEIYSSLWRSCDELRGGMDASQYKDYVLTLLFVKYVSDKYANRPDSLIQIPPGGGFADMVALAGTADLGDKINTIIARLAEANDLRGVIDVADFNDADKLGRGKEMVDRLSKLIGIFNSPMLDFRRNRAEGDDLLGDAYEYLMRNFATESGKSKGQFYTPAEVSRIMASVIGIGGATRADQTIYDPTAGSGSLLIKAHDEAKSRTGFDLAIYGQEMDNATAALAKMNMFLHDCPTAEIWQGNTLANPHFVQDRGALKTFDFAVANPPFSAKAWANGLDPANDRYARFALGTPPAKNGDYAFLLHILASLKSAGKGAVILPHGVLFRGNAEAAIRKSIVCRGYIKAIIGLPANIFYGTGIPACIIVLDKEQARTRAGIFMVDASKGFRKEGPKKSLRAQDIHRIVDTVTRQLDTPRYARLVPLAEIEANGFNLNIPRYIDSTEPEDLQDIEAHLRGGIPNPDVDALDRYWQVFPAVRATLFAPADRPGYVGLRVPPAEINAAVFGHPEFTAFNHAVTARFDQWTLDNTPRLTDIARGGNPMALIEALSEDLLRTFAQIPLLDPYDVYQHLMDYWANTMQDDAYLLVQEGWVAVLDGKPNTDLLSNLLLIRRYFAAEQAHLETLEAAREALTRQMEEIDEEHGGEEGALAEAKTDKGKLSRPGVKARLAALTFEPDTEEERAMLKQYLTLLDREAAAARALKEATPTLDAKVTAAYATLSEHEIKVLVVHDKWLAALATSVQSELDRVSQALTGRITQLAERYATPLPALTDELAALSARVDTHLARMGLAWN